jgi:hypothetical protein
MAEAQNAQSAAAAAGPRFAMVDPDSYESTGGLAKNFWGTIISEYLAPIKMKSGTKAGQWELHHVIEIKAEDPDLGKDGIVTEWSKAADLKQWVPADEHGNPAGGAALADFVALSLGAELPAGVTEDQIRGLRGVYAIPGAQNTQKGLPKNTKNDAFWKAVRKAGFPGNLKTARFDPLVGYRAYWVRIPFEKEDGSTFTNDKGQTIDILVPAEFDASVKPGATEGVAGKKASKKKAEAPTPTASVAPATLAAASSVAAETKTVKYGANEKIAATDAKVVAALLDGLKARGGEAHRTDLAEFAFTAAQGKGLNRINDPNWMAAAASASGGKFEFDVVSGMVSLPAGGDDDEDDDDETGEPDDDE